MSGDPRTRASLFATVLVAAALPARSQTLEEFIDRYRDCVRQTAPEGFSSNPEWLQRDAFIELLREGKLQSHRAFQPIAKFHGEARWRPERGWTCDWLGPHFGRAIHEARQIAEEEAFGRQEEPDPFCSFDGMLDEMMDAGGVPPEVRAEEGPRTAARDILLDKLKDRAGEPIGISWGDVYEFRRRLAWAECKAGGTLEAGTQAACFTSSVDWLGTILFDTRAGRFTTESALILVGPLGWVVLGGFNVTEASLQCRPDMKAMAWEAGLTLTLLVPYCRAKVVPKGCVLESEGVQTFVKRVFGEKATATSVRKLETGLAELVVESEAAAARGAVAAATTGSLERDVASEAEALLKRAFPAEFKGGLSAAEKEAVERAHRVGEGQLGRDGKTAASYYNYTDEQLAEKVSILKEQPRFTAKHRGLLLREGVAGSLGPEAEKLYDALRREGMNEATARDVSRQVVDYLERVHGMDGAEVRAAAERHLSNPGPRGMFHHDRIELGEEAALEGLRSRVATEALGRGAGAAGLSPPAQSVARHAASRGLSATEANRMGREVIEYLERVEGLESRELERAARARLDDAREVSELRRRLAVNPDAVLAEWRNELRREAARTSIRDSLLSPAPGAARPPFSEAAFDRWFEIHREDLALQLADRSAFTEAAGEYLRTAHHFPAQEVPPELLDDFVEHVVRPIAADPVLGTSEAELLRAARALPPDVVAGTTTGATQAEELVQELQRMRQRIQAGH